MESKEPGFFVAEVCCGSTWSNTNLWPGESYSSLGMLLYQNLDENLVFFDVFIYLPKKMMKSNDI